MHTGKMRMAYIHPLEPTQHTHTFAHTPWANKQERIHNICCQCMHACMSRVSAHHPGFYNSRIHRSAAVKMEKNYASLCSPLQHSRERIVFLYLSMKSGERHNTVPSKCLPLCLPAFPCTLIAPYYSESWSVITYVYRQTSIWTLVHTD